MTNGLYRWKYAQYFGKTEQWGDLMRICNRPFSEKQNDYEKMWDFLVNDYTDKTDRFIWTIGRLGDWKYGLFNETKLFPNFTRKNAQLWLNNFDELIGFVISEDCNSGFTVFAKRGSEFLYPEMIDWVKSNWNTRGDSLATEVHEYQDIYVEALLKEGFKKGEIIAVTRQYKLGDKVKEVARIEAGFHIEDMLNNPDLKGKAYLYCNAWRNLNEVSSFDLLKYEYNRESPCFNPKFDLSLVDENGRHLSSCVAFIDHRNNYAEIEKICTHNEYRNRGFAEAVIRECFRRLYKEGIQYAYITGYSNAAKNLYEKLGAVKSKNWYSYTLAIR